MPEHRRHVQVLLTTKVSRVHQPHHNYPWPSWWPWESYHRRRHHNWRVIERRILQPGENTLMDITTSVGHTVTYAINFLDALGNPMVATQVPDAPPTWGDAPAPAGCATFTAGGLSATDLCNAAGLDTVTVTLSVGGTAFTATSIVTISAAPQVLTSIELVPTVS
jgi:hypothetical protein